MTAEVEVLCRPVGQHLGSVTIQSADGGLRCRFTANGSTLADVPAQTEEDGEAFYCRCSSKVRIPGIRSSFSGCLLSD